MNSQFIFIIGEQGSGKSTLARDIIDGLRKRCSEGMLLTENEHLTVESPPADEIDHLRQVGMRVPYTSEFIRPAWFIAEYQERPTVLPLRKGDVVIQIARVEADARVLKHGAPT